ncbi:5'-methylthioadenosine/adenosylhomocysteine nucleosidase [Massilia sp. PWRC2]|uniref:5'-methylthioadenosine/adenosylhomocysteine nucleosidase n=1 Tax=Massilia sp. PWRC2 TaxID=2804626 RepID=UPI003CED862C
MNRHPIGRLGIISALQEEQQGLVEAMQGATTHIHGRRDYTTGTLWGIDAVCVLSRIGKVAAAMTATLLVEKFGITHLLFTGVAGSGGNGVQVGDIVVADCLVQHDMDASPLFPAYEVPLTGISYFKSDRCLTKRLLQASTSFVASDLAVAISLADRHLFGLQQVRVHQGVVASGDQFIDSAARIARLRDNHPGLLAVEMEGAAVAQVCFDLNVPFTVMRTISDNANEAAATDFLHFVQAVAAQYAFYIIQRFCELSCGPSCKPSCKPDRQSGPVA